MSTDHSPETEERPGPRRRRGLLPVVSVAAAVLLAGGGGAYWASVASEGGDSSTPGNGGGKPPRLALDGQAMAARGAAQSDKGGPGIAPGEPMGPRALRAAADLPDGPDKAPVHRPERKATESGIKDLAKALKLDGTPEKKDDHWEVAPSGESGPGTPMLGVNTRDEGPEWAYMSMGAATGRCAVPAPGQEHLRGGGKPASAPGCLPGPGLDKGDPVSGGKAKDAVRPVLRTLGLEDAEVDAGKAVGSARTVTARPQLDGRATHGWDTTFMVNGKGRIVHAQGHWADAEKGAEYPVMSASKTLNELNKARQSGGGGTVQCAREQSGTPAHDRADFVPGPPCGSGKGKGPEKVTGAAFGYAAQSSGGKPVLVPSWIFDVQLPGGKGTYPVAHPAVEPEFLKKPDSAGSAPDRPAPGKSESATTERPQPGDGSGKESGGGGIGAGGSSGSSGTQALTSYDADGRTLTLTFWGGVCDKYKAVADESGSQVKLTLKSEPKDPGKKVCVKIAKRMTAKVTLDKALGDRKVVDTRDGDALPRR